MKIVKLLEDAGLLIEDVENELKKQVGFLGMLAATFSASLSGNMLSGKVVIRAGAGAIRAGHDF